MRVLCAGGYVDHVHILVSLPTAMSVAKAVQLVKGGSAKWIHQSFSKRSEFFRQEGYAAFSVSLSHLDKTIRYIESQAYHHRAKTFREEYLDFLKAHGIDYDEQYVFG